MSKKLNGYDYLGYMIVLIGLIVMIWVVSV